MPTAVAIRVGAATFSAELDDNPSARELLARLPMELAMSRWGDEYWGDCGVSVAQSPDARELMRAGELALWPPGGALCIFFGPTPASTGSEPRAASPVNPIGRLTGDWSALKGLGRSIRAMVTPI